MYGTRLKRWHCWLPLFLAIATTSAVADESIVVSGEIVDAVSGERLPARLYVRDAKGFWHFPTAAAPGDVVRYERANYWDKTQAEMHATLAAKPFDVELAAGA